MRYTLVFLLLTLTTSVVAIPQDTIRDVGISKSGPPVVKIAVPPFTSASTGDKAAQLTQVFNDTLWEDLDFSGNLDLASRSFYPRGDFREPADIKTEEWTAAGIQAQYVAYGFAEVVGNSFRATARLRDLAAQQEPIRSVFRGLDDEIGARIAAHEFADRILEQLGFGRGIGRTQISFVSSRTGNKEIWLMDYDGKNQRALTAIRNIAMAPNWSRRDDRIAYTAWRTGKPHIEVMSASGERQPFQAPEGATSSTPAWSSDGRIAYSSNVDGNTELYIADGDGKNRKRITFSPAIDTSPSFNPANPSQISFVSSRSGTPQIYIMNSDGTNVVRITEEGGDAENPAWSPDGKMIAFAWQKPRTGAFELFIYEIATAKFYQLTSDQGSNERPTWAPDGKHLAFTSSRTGASQIYSMTLDGKKVRLLTTSAGINEGATWSGFAAP